MNAEKEYKKVLFHLEKDSDDYPPDDWESVWAYEVEDGLFTIDNIPFYVRGLSIGDIVSVDKRDGELFFKRIEKLSGNSVVRVVIFEMSRTNGLERAMKRMGCNYEGSHVKGFLAFDLPPKVNFHEVKKFLENGESHGFWEYEEASVRHD